VIAATLILLVATAAVYALARRRGDGSAQRGVKQGLRIGCKMLPLLLVAFLLAGLLPAAIPTAVIEKWLGAGAGLPGILLASLLGALLPVGPYVVFPMVAGVHRSGASVAAMVAFVTGWSLWGIGKLPFELALLNGKFALARTLVVAVFPPLAGVLVWLIMR
jgi:uncharacterized membrane protein YraQ (UPF0718 family)